MTRTQFAPLFLAQVKRFVAEGPLVLVPRRASLAFMADRGMTMATLEEIILSLEVDDCFDGPKGTGIHVSQTTGPLPSSPLHSKERSCT